METNEKVEKKSFQKAIIVLVILTVIALGAGFAYARYVTRLNGTSTADIAKWSFKVNGKTDESFVINLADTRKGITQDAEVQEGYIGPGTAGAFELELDATGSEVSLEYDINLNVDYSDNKVFPKNLIFYSDEEMNNAIYHSDNNINLNGFIGWNDGSKVHTKTIYWKWDYETGSTQTEKDSNDIADSYWMGKTITLSINVTAKQVNENPTTGQYAVTLDANGGTIQGYGNSSQATKMVTYGETYGDLPIPSREGYEFKGWNGKNLYLKSSYNTNATIENDVVMQNDADSRTNLQWKIQAVNDGNIINTFEIKHKNTVGVIDFSFVKDSSFNMISFGLNGEKKDTKIYCYVDQLKNDTTYTLSFNILDVTQGSISWNHIQIEEENVATDYEPYYITQSTQVTQNQNHTLTAIWEPIN